MQRAELINAIAAGAQPYEKNGSFILKTRRMDGVVGRTLVGPVGPTPLGRLWAETTGKQLPEKGFQMDQRTIHRGASEYIKDLQGKKHQVRRCDGRAYTYTRLGPNYFDANKAKFVVEVPVRIEGRRGTGRDHWRDGEAYERRAMMPVSFWGGRYRTQRTVHSCAKGNPN